MDIRDADIRNVVDFVEWSHEGVHSVRPAQSSIKYKLNEK